jgi:hypothetical protein
MLSSEWPSLSSERSSQYQLTTPSFMTHLSRYRQVVILHMEHTEHWINTYKISSPHRMERLRILGMPGISSMYVHHQIKRDIVAEASMCEAYIVSIAESQRPTMLLAGDTIAVGRLS